MENQIKADKAESVSPPRTPPKPISLHGRNNAESNNNLFLKIPLAFYEALLISVFLIAVLFGYLLFTRFGLGSPFATAPVELMDADTHHSVLQPIAELPVPPGNIAVSVTGRVFFTFHPEFQPINTKVAELTFIRERRNTFRKFPSADFQDECISCLAIRVDMQERLWLLDHAGYALKGTPKLHCFGLRQNETDKDRLLFTYEFPAEVAGMGSFLNDFQIDQSGKFIYIADTSLIRGDPGIVVFSVENKKSFRVLSSHESMFGESAFFYVGETSVKLPGPFGLRINVDSIALDRVAGRWLYFGAMTSHNLYAVPVEAIHLALNNIADHGKSSNEAVTAAAKLSASVMLILDTKPITDGLSTDPMGNIYMTAVDLSAIIVAVAQRKPEREMSFSTPPKFKLRKLVQSDDLLRWPDGLSFGPKGLYIASSALHLSLMGLNMKSQSPFHIHKIAFETIQGMQPGAPYANDTRLPFHGQ